MRIKWKVSEAPSGRYRSFHKWSWPTAHYTDIDNKICAAISCNDSYDPRAVKTGNHGPLTLRIVNHSSTKWEWADCIAKFKTLKEAKEQLPQILAIHPEFVPQKKIYNHSDLAEVFNVVKEAFSNKLKTKEVYTDNVNILVEYFSNVLTGIEHGNTDTFVELMNGINPRKKFEVI